MGLNRILCVLCLLSLLLAVGCGSKEEVAEPEAEAEQQPVLEVEIPDELADSVTLVNVTGAIELPRGSEIEPADLDVFTALGGFSEVDDDGDFEIKANEQVFVSMVFAADQDGDLLLTGLINTDDDDFTLDARSTAMSIAYLCPFIATSDPDQAEAILDYMQELAEFDEFAEIIEDLIADGESPFECEDDDFIDSYAELYTELLQYIDQEFYQAAWDRNLPDQPPQLLASYDRKATGAAKQARGFNNTEFHLISPAQDAYFTIAITGEDDDDTGLYEAVNLGRREVDLYAVPLDGYLGDPIPGEDPELIGIFSAYRAIPTLSSVIEDMLDESGFGRRGYSSTDEFEIDFGGYRYYELILYGPGPISGSYSDGDLERAAGPSFRTFINCIFFPILNTVVGVKVENMACASSLLSTSADLVIDIFQAFTTGRDPNKFLADITSTAVSGALGFIDDCGSEIFGDGIRAVAGIAGSFLRILDVLSTAEQAIGGATSYLFAPGMSDWQIYITRVIDFPDPNLEAAVREEIGKPRGDITDLDIEDLTTLYASEMEISNLEGMQYCTSLVELSLSSNEISDISPLEGLTNLTSLYMVGNEISDISALAGMTNLSLLWIWLNDISDISPLSRLTNLEILQLDDNNIVGLGPLRNLTNLKSLGLTNNRITSVGPLSNLSNLEILALSGNRITDIDSLSHLEQLEDLFLVDNNISDITPLSNNSGFGRGDMISLKGNPLNDAAISLYIPSLQDRGVEVKYDPVETRTLDDPPIIEEVEIIVPPLEEVEVTNPALEEVEEEERRIETTGGLIKTFTGHTGHVYSVAFSPDGRYALSGSYDHTMKLWDVETGRELRTFRGHDHAISSVNFSPDGHHALSGSWDDTLKLWNTDSGNVERTFTGHSFSILSVAYSLDGHYVLSGSFDGTMKLWDVRTGAEVQTFTGNGRPINAVAFSPDGRYVLSGSMDNTLKLWNTGSGNEVRTFIGHNHDVNCVAFSHDGRFVLSGGQDGYLILWDVNTGDKLRTFGGGSIGITSVSFSPDGRYALSGEYDLGDNVKLWDLSTGNEVHIFNGHTEWVHSVAFSPDGHYALSGSEDGTLKLWDLGL